MLIDSGVVTSSLSVSGSYNQTGNAVITGSLTVTGGITGSITSASYAFNADLLDGLDSTAFLYTSSFNAFSSSYSNRISGSEVTASVLVAASSSLSIRVSNTEATASSLVNASGSFSTRVTNNELTGSSLTTASGSFSTRVTSLETASGSFSTRTTNLETTSSNLVNASGSFSTRVTNTEATASSLVTASGSLSTRVTNTEATASNLVPRVVNLEATASNLTTASGSFSTRVTNTEATASNLVPRVVNLESTASNVVPRVVNLEATSSNLVTASGSASTRLTNLESASGSFSTRVTNTEATASNLVPRVVNLETTASNFVVTSGSASSRMTNLEATASSLTTRTTNLETASGSFSTRVTNTELTASALTTASGSFSTRVTNEEATGSRLVTASGSFSTRVTNTEATASSLVTASGSASTRITSLESASGSFSTRVTTLESASGSTSTRLTNLETASGSFSARVTNTEATASNLVPRVTLLETTASNFVLTSGSASSRLTNLEATASNLTTVTNNLTTASGSFSTRTTNLESTASVLTNASASFVNMSSSLSIRVTNAEASVTSLNAKTGSYATTGSNTFTGTQTVQGTIIAQTLNVQQVTSSIVYSSGSNTFGKLPGTDVQSMTGSLRVSGSGDHWVVGGNVGIGTSSPGYTLDVNGTTRNLGSNEIQFRWDRTSSKAWGLASDSAGGYIKNITDNNIPIYWLNAGNVGIDTTAPAAKLDVYGGSFAVRGTQTRLGITPNYGGNGDIPAGTLISVDDVTNNNLAIIPSSGGTAGSKVAGVAYNGSGWRSMWEYANVSSGNPNLLLVKTAGNVGIGTTTPNYLLHVNGTVGINGTTIPIANNTYTLGGGSNKWSQIWGSRFFADDGSVGAPTYTFAGDQDSGFWKPGDGILATSTNGVERMRIDANGNVGVGTSNPNSTFQVSKGGVIFQVTDTNKTANNTLSIYGLTQTSFAIATGNSGSFSGGEKIVITDAGSIGIKTTLPSYTLDVNGSSRIATTLNIASGIGASDAYIELGSGRSANGYAYIDIVGDTTYTDYGLRLIRGNGGANTTSELLHRGTGAFNISALDAATLTFKTSNSDRITILSEGNVGINTTLPQAKLHVVNDAAGTDGFIFQEWSYTPSTTDVYSLMLKQTVTAGVVRYNFSMVNSSTAYNDVLVLDRGNVGIGTTSPSYKFHVVGSSTGGGGLIYSGNSSSNYSFVVGDYATNTNFHVRGDGVTYMRGNVGIGTTNPEAPLNLSPGSGAASGNVALRFGGPANYPSLELGTVDNYDAMIRTYGNDLKIYSGHWRTIGATSSENHSIFFYTSKNGSTNWSSPKMKLDPDGVLTVISDVIAYGSPSDIAFKTNIKPLEGALDKVMKLQGVSFTWKEDTDTNKMVGIKDDLGFIAQEVQEVLPDLVRKNDDGLLSLRDKGIIPILVEAIKEQQRQIDELKYLLQNK